MSILPTIQVTCHISSKAALHTLVMLVILVGGQVGMQARFFLVSLRTHLNFGLAFFFFL